MVNLPPCSKCGKWNKGMHARIINGKITPTCHVCYEKNVAERQFKGMIEALGKEKIKEILNVD